MGRDIGHGLVASGQDAKIVDETRRRPSSWPKSCTAQGHASAEAAGPDAELSDEVVVLALYCPGALELAKESSVPFRTVSLSNW
jgi:hypothetical protein